LHGQGDAIELHGPRLRPLADPQLADTDKIDVMANVQSLRCIAAPPPLDL